MAYITITNTFTSGAVAASGQVNQNFTDLTTGLSDGTKDVHVRDISVTSAIVTGNVTIGKSTFESWDATYGVLQIGGHGAIVNQIAEMNNSHYIIAHNAYYNGAWKYLMDDEPSCQLDMGTGILWLRSVASGTADATITYSSIIYADSSAVITYDGSGNIGWKVDRTNDKLYSDILKTTQATAAAPAYVFVDTATGELYSNVALPA